MNVLLVQPPWPSPAKIKSKQKYFPYPLIKLAALYRQHGNRVALALGNNASDVPFQPDKILVTSTFSYWFSYLKESVDTYRFLYPDADIEIGGPFASLKPDIIKTYFPFAKVVIGPVPEAEKIEPAWDLAPELDVSIVSASLGCWRGCSFCYYHRLDSYQTFPWESVKPKIRHRKVIFNDANFVFHPQAREILKKLAEFKINGKPLSDVEFQSGFDVRYLSKHPDIIPLMKEARVKNVRIAWDGGLEMRPMVEQTLEHLVKYYDLRALRCYMIYNYDLSFDTVCEKLKWFEKWKLGVVHSRFRPIELLNDGYISQKRAQSSSEYYIHPGWTDKRVRAIGSVASDISRMARLDRVNTVDEVRAYYGKPTRDETLKMAS